MEPPPVEQRIVSSGPHEPPRESGKPSAITCTVPPLDGIFFSFPFAKKPTERLAGDQNGYSAFSVPGRGWAATSSIALSQSTAGFPGAEAANTMARPSGER